jgi:hypothetical protein
LKAAIAASLSCGGQPAVHQADPQFRQEGGQPLGGDRRRLALQRFRFLDQRADPVRLAAVPAGSTDAVDHFFAAAVGRGDRFHRPAAGRQLVDDRGIQIGVGAHRQGTRDRRGGHDQLVRSAPIALPAFLAQRQPLMHAEAVLFVHDRQRQFGEAHAVLKQGVGADRDLNFTGGEPLQQGPPRPSGQAVRSARRLRRPTRSSQF